MILELGDGREVHLPDDMEDEAARQLKMFILASDKRARDAEATSLALRHEIIALRTEMGNFGKLTEHMAGLREDFKRIGSEIVAAAMADRVAEPDATGEYTRSKAVLRK